MCPSELGVRPMWGGLWCAALGLKLSLRNGYDAVPGSCEQSYAREATYTLRAKMYSRRMIRMNSTQISSLWFRSIHGLLTSQKPLSGRFPSQGFRPRNYNILKCAPTVVSGSWKKGLYQWTIPGLIHTHMSWYILVWPCVINSWTMFYHVMPYKFSNINRPPPHFSRCFNNTSLLAAVESRAWLRTNSCRLARLSRAGSNVNSPVGNWSSWWSFFIAFSRND